MYDVREIFSHQFSAQTSDIGTLNNAVATLGFSARPTGDPNDKLLRYDHNTNPDLRAALQTTAWRVGDTDGRTEYRIIVESRNGVEQEFNRVELDSHLAKQLKDYQTREEVSR